MQAAAAAGDPKGGKPNVVQYEQLQTFNPASLVVTCALKVVVLISVAYDDYGGVRNFRHPYLQIFFVFPSRAAGISAIIYVAPGSGPFVTWSVMSSTNHCNVSDTLGRGIGREYQLTPNTKAEY